MFVPLLIFVSTNSNPLTCFKDLILIPWVDALHGVVSGLLLDLECSTMRMRGHVVFRRLLNLIFDVKTPSQSNL